MIPRLVLVWVIILLVGASLFACTGNDTVDPRVCANFRAAIAAYEAILADGGTLNQTQTARLTAARIFVEANCLTVPPPA